MDFKKMISQGLNNLIHGNRTESVIGIDIGTSSIKVVQLKTKAGVPVLETYGTLSLGPYADQAVGSVTNLSVEKITLALGDLMRESGVTTKESAVSIPSSASLVFLIDLPGNIPEKQFSDVVQTEARKYIPVPVSEVSLDFWPIPTRDETPYDFGNSSGSPEPKNKTEVLIAAIHKDTLSKYNEIVSSANLSASFFEIEIFSSIRATFGHELTTVVLVDIGAQKTKITIVESGVTRSLHIVNRGSFDISNAISKSLGITFAEAEDLKRTHGLVPDPTHPALVGASMTSVDYIISEMKTVVSQYEKKHNRSVSKIILTGGGSLLPGFVDTVQGRFTMPVIFGNPFSKVEAPAFLSPVLSSIGPEFSVALGLALRRLQSE